MFTKRQTNPNVRFYASTCRRNETQVLSATGQACPKTTFQSGQACAHASLQQSAGALMYQRSTSEYSRCAMVPPGTESRCAFSKSSGRARDRPRSPQFTGTLDHTAQTRNISPGTLPSCDLTRVACQLYLATLQL
jgi:hypothetical protein